MEVNTNAPVLSKGEQEYAPTYRTENDTESDPSDYLPKKRGRKPKPKKVEEDKPKKTRGKGTNWLFVKKFDNALEAEEAVRLENTWSIQTNRRTEEGRKQVYRCNKVKNRGPQCIAQILLLYDAYSDDVILFRKEFEHDHHLIGSRSGYHGIDPETKRQINALFDLHITKPRVVFNHLMEKPGLKMPTIMQLNNYLNDLRRRKYGCSANLGKAKKWIAGHTDVPENEHEAFVISYCVQESSTKICYVLSTKKLLELASGSTMLHADAIRRLNWQGFQLFIVGTTDVNGKFYPLCLAVSSTDTAEVFKILFNGLKDAIASMYTCFFKPSVLVCDDEAIGEAFTNTFGLTVQVRTCWTHTKNEIKSAIEQMDEKKRNSILDDVECLHLATEEDFNKAAELFLLKWEEEQSFTNYFREEWLVRRQNWHLSTNTPTTNDAIETINKKIKDTKTIYERLPVKKFLTTVCDTVTEWSQNKEIFATKYTIELTDWAEAHQWLKLDRKTTILHSEDDKVTYLVQSSKNPAISRTTYLQSNALWKTFDEYKEIYFSHWKVTMFKDSLLWTDSTCTCPIFATKSMCKHVLGLAVQLKYASVPVEATKMALKENVKVKEENPTDTSLNSDPSPNKSKKVYTLAAEKKFTERKTDLEPVQPKKNLRRSRLRSELEAALRKEKSDSNRNSISWSDQDDDSYIKTPKKKRKAQQKQAKRKGKRKKVSLSTSSEQNQDFWSEHEDSSRNSGVSSRIIDSTNQKRTSRRFESKNCSERPDIRYDTKNLASNARQEDEFYFFGQSMAAQLRRLPINVALDLQVQFQNELTKARMKSINSGDNVVHSSTSIERNPLEGCEVTVILPNKTELEDSN